MTDFDVIAAAFVILGAFAVLLGLIVIANLIAISVLDRRRQRSARTDIQARRQERDAQRHLRVGTGRVQAAPINPPLAPVTPMWPRAVNDDDRTAA